MRLVNQISDISEYFLQVYVDPVAKEHGAFLLILTEIVALIAGILTGLPAHVAAG